MLIDNIWILWPLCKCTLERNAHFYHVQEIIHICQMSFCHFSFIPPLFAFIEECLELQIIAKISQNQL